jgi:hypothetical protein
MNRVITIKRIPKPREAGVSPIDRDQRPRRWVVRMSSTWGGRAYYVTKREAIARAGAASKWYGIPLSPGVPR